MALISDRLRLVYLPVPKNACTSLKTLFFEADTGRTLESLAEEIGGALRLESVIHRRFVAREDGGRLPRLGPDHAVVAVLRDPVDRFLSGYRNRILARRDLRRVARQPAVRAVLDERGLSDAPDAEAFAMGIAGYVAAHPMLRHHFRPQADFLRHAVPRLTLVTNLGGLDRVVALFEERAGRRLALRHLQTAGREFQVPPLSAAALAALRAYYAEDDALLRHFGLARA
jgi:hypothetical protein